jgi:hypothetical protein
MKVVLVATVFGLAWLCGWADPRRVRPRGALGEAWKRAGRRGRGKIRIAMLEGRAVNDPQLAGLAAEMTRERMAVLDYRGPLLRRELVMAATLIAGVVLVLIIGPRHIGGNELLVLAPPAVTAVWVVCLRRLTPNRRDRYDTLRCAYEANLALAEQGAGPGLLDRARVGL